MVTAKKSPKLAEGEWEGWRKWRRERGNSRSRDRKTNSGNMCCIDIERAWDHLRIVFFHCIFQLLSRSRSHTISFAVLLLGSLYALWGRCRFVAILFILWSFTVAIYYDYNFINVTIWNHRLECATFFSVFCEYMCNTSWANRCRHRRCSRRPSRRRNSKFRYEP